MSKSTKNHLEDLLKTEVNVTQLDITCSVREDKKRCAIANAFVRAFGEMFSKIQVGVVYAVFCSDNDGHENEYIWLSEKIRLWINKYDLSKDLVSPIRLRLEKSDDNFEPQYYFDFA